MLPTSAGPGTAGSGFGGVGRPRVCRAGGPATELWLPGAGLVYPVLQLGRRPPPGHPRRRGVRLLAVLGPPIISGSRRGGARYHRASGDGRGPGAGVSNARLAHSSGEPSSMSFLSRSQSTLSHHSRGRDTQPKSVSKRKANYPCRLAPAPQRRWGRPTRAPHAPTPLLRTGMPCSASARTAVPQKPKFSWTRDTALYRRCQPGGRGHPARRPLLHSISWPARTMPSRSVSHAMRRPGD